MKKPHKNIKTLLQQTRGWTEIQKAMEQIRREGFEVLIAGGACRDALLGQIPKDMDLASSARPEELLNIFPSAKGVWAKYGLVFLPLKTKNNLEITSFRKEGPYKDGRRPEKISYSNREQDAWRRDFTVNALFYDLWTEQILDFTGGLEDLQNKTLRAVGSAKERFEEDHLRALRALRLAHQLQFQIEDETKKAIPDFAGKIKQLAKERIREELEKMLSTGRMGQALKSLKDQNMFHSVFPDLKELPTQLDNPFDFWNRDFSFYKDMAFVWTLLVLPFFYGETKKTESFLKKLSVPSSHRKQSLSYLQAVTALLSRQSSFTEKLQALNRQKEPVAELAGFWLDSLKEKKDSLKQIVREFEKREEKGSLPKAFVTGADLLQLSPAPDKKNFSFLLKQAYEYQIEQTQASKTEILKQIMKNKVKKP